MSERAPTCLLIVNWNCASDIVALLDHIGGTAERDVIVIDNDSTDRAHEQEILATRPELTVVQAERNDGYGAGMNRGMVTARDRGYELAILLNPDARPTRDAIRQIEANLVDADIVGIQQHVTHGDSGSSTYPTAARGPSLWPSVLRCPGCAEGRHDVDSVSGAAIGVRLEPIVALGGFDERFFHYKEETDLCFRVRRDGRRILWLCRPSVWHERGGSLARESALADFYRIRNEVLGARLRLGRSWWFRWRLHATVSTLGITAIRRGVPLRVVLKAACSGARMRGGRVDASHLR